MVAPSWSTDLRRLDIGPDFSHYLASPSPRITTRRWIIESKRRSCPFMGSAAVELYPFYYVSPNVIQLWRRFSLDVINVGGALTFVVRYE
jgi:hypothetical protein